MIVTRYNRSFSDDEISKLGDIVDIIEGTLIDNYLIERGGKYIILLEYPLNCWTSAHKLIEDKNGDMILKLWDSFKEEYNIAVG